MRSGCPELAGHPLLRTGCAGAVSAPGERRRLAILPEGNARRSRLRALSGLSCRPDVSAVTDGWWGRLHACAERQSLRRSLQATARSARAGMVAVPRVIQRHRAIHAASPTTLISARRTAANASTSLYGATSMRCTRAVVAFFALLIGFGAAPTWTAESHWFAVPHHGPLPHRRQLVRRRRHLPALRCAGLPSRNELHQWPWSQARLR